MVVAMSSKVSPSWPSSSVPETPVRAVRSPFLIWRAVEVMRWTGAAMPRDTKYPITHASTRAIAAAPAMAP